MTRHKRALDAANDDSMVDAQQIAKSTLQVKDDNHSSCRGPENREEYETSGNTGGLELQVRSSRRRSRLARESCEKSVVLVERGQKQPPLPQHGCLFQLSEFKLLDAPTKSLPDERSLLLGASNTMRRTTLPNASIDPNGPGGLPANIKIRPPTPSPPVNWRESPRQQGPLSLDMRRIDSDYLLSKDFVHDINQMLDKLRGWPADLVKPYEISFQQDPENNERRVSIIDFMMRTWVVKIANPNKLIWRSSFSHDYTFADLPEDCQLNGCDFGCPRRITRIEQHSTLQKKKWTRSIYQTEISPIREGSNISVDLPRIFGEQSLPLPRLRWERLGYRGLKDRSVTKLLEGARNTPPRSTEKRRQRFKACSPPKRTKKDGVLESQPSSSASTHNAVSKETTLPEAEDKFKPEVTYIERLPDKPGPSPAIPLRPIDQTCSDPVSRMDEDEGMQF